MADSITSFTLERSSDNVNWSTLATLPNSDANPVRSYDDATAPNPTLYYRLTGHTQQGLTIPYNIVSVTGTAPAWPKLIGGTGLDYASGCAVDQIGNIVLLGAFSGTVDFGGGNLTSAGSSDMFLAKYSPTGAHIWSKRFGGVNGERPRCIAVDSNGNIFVSGSFSATANFGGSDLTSAGAIDPFLAKYDSSGNHLWSFSFLQSTFTDAVSAIATDSLGNVIVTGAFRGGTWSSPLAVKDGFTLYSAYDSQDAFLIKFSGNGTCLWAKNFDNYGALEEGTGVGVLSDDTIVATGYTTGGGLTLGGARFTDAGGYLGRFAADGTHLWSKMVGINSPARPLALALDPNGYICISGYFPNRQSDFGGGPIYGTALSTDLFVARYGSDGTYQWAKPLPGTLYGVPILMSIDSVGDIAVVGYFRGTVNFGAQSLSSDPNADNGFVARYTSAGNPVWAKAVVSSSNNALNGVAMDFARYAIISGGFSGSATFNGRTFNTNNGSSDIFIDRLSP